MKRAALILAVALAACTKPPEMQQMQPPPPPLKVIANPAPSMPDGHPALKDLAIGSRGPRRMSVDQLERSFDQIAELPPGTVKLPPDLALTLGRPDYKRLTEEQLQPTPLFMKFMLDLSAYLCPLLANAEATRPTDATPPQTSCMNPTSPMCQKFFTRFPTVDENIRYLVLRFTGIEGADADPYVTRLKAAYETGSQSSATLSGYQAVCASLFTSPEFLLY